MQLKTKHFGDITYDPNDVITFEEGLPGFRDSVHFILMADAPTDLFQWLQSTDDGDLAFVVVDVRQIMPEYSPLIDPGAIASLEDGGELSYYNIAVVPDDLEKMRVNLKAPIVINTTARKGKQVIAANEEYGVRHYVFADSNQPAQMGG